MSSGGKKTLLGVDAIHNHKLVAENLNEKGILDLLRDSPRAKIIISPIGGRHSVDELCKKSGGIVLIDESYYEFSHFSVIDMVKSHPNLAVTRTMSKAFGLAGLKVGYMVAGEAVLQAFSSLDLPLRPTTSSIYAAVEALKNTEYMERNVAHVIAERERVTREASNIGVEVYPSSANFLLMRTNAPDAARRLRELGVLVFDPSNQLPSEFIRVSVGTPEEDDPFLSSLKQIVDGR